MTGQLCPICSARVAGNAHYPRYVCATCVAKACSVDGRPLEFSNVDFPGGFAARYADTGMAYPSHECFIEGVKCRANEARYGGVVIEAAEKSASA